MEAGRDDGIHVVRLAQAPGGSVLASPASGPMGETVGGHRCHAEQRPEQNGFEPGLATSAAPVKLDNAGRITIPDEMAEAADITNEAVLAGMLDRFEIWNPKRYAQVKASDNAIVGKHSRKWIKYYESI